jgi:rubrerythrin
MYARMAKEAKAEGFLELAKRFEGVAKIESIHEQRYRDLLKDVKNKIVFKRTHNVI